MAVNFRDAATILRKKAAAQAWVCSGEDVEDESRWQASGKLEDLEIHMSLEEAHDDKGTNKIYQWLIIYHSSSGKMLLAKFRTAST